MKGKYFDTGWLKPITPVTNQIVNDKSDLAFADKDILFDWFAFDVPRGTHKLVSASLIHQGNHGARQAEKDQQLWFARSIDGVAPPSLGTPNVAITGTGHRKHMLGIVHIDQTQATGDLSPFNQFYSTAMAGSAGSLNNSGSLVIESAPNSGSSAGFDRVYVAGITMGAVNFSTNVLLNQAGNQGATTTTTTLTVNGAAATKVFEVGDVIQAMDLAAIGTITALTTTSITVDLCEAALEDDDEILTTSPIKVKLAFEA